MPFWFWNDDLEEGELQRQLDDFLAHGVGGVVIHPRVGLPRSIGWMSPRMLELVRFTVEAAAGAGHGVILDDEGMYPSGSSCGQVGGEPRLSVPVSGTHRPEPEQTFNSRHRRICSESSMSPQKGGGDRSASRACIRGLHYIGEGPAEDEPPAGDLLNPDAVSCFIRLVYDRFQRAWAITSARR